MTPSRKEFVEVAANLKVIISVGRLGGRSDDGVRQLLVGAPPGDRDEQETLSALWSLGWILSNRIA